MSEATQCSRREEYNKEHDFKFISQMLLKEAISIDDKLYNALVIFKLKGNLHPK